MNLTAVPGRPPVAGAAAAADVDNDGGKEDEQDVVVKVRAGAGPRAADGVSGIGLAVLGAAAAGTAGEDGASDLKLAATRSPGVLGLHKAPIPCRL